MEKGCGCQGIRSCLLCEDDGGLPSDSIYPRTTPLIIFTQCHKCGELSSAREDSNICTVPCSDSRVLVPTFVPGQLPEGLVFDGVTVLQDFIDKVEERALIREIDEHGWAESQSGRRKQDYGPKANFKRHKVQLGNFDGMPSFIENLLPRLSSQVAAHFIPVELCCLDYRPERGAAIDPHVDDCWLWGERLLTINLLSHTILTFSTTHVTTPASRNPSNTDHTFSPSHSAASVPVQIEVLLPRRSLVVVEGSARYHWKHSIQRHHVVSRRVAVTLRELTDKFLPGGKSYEAAGKRILELAASFNGHPTNLHRTIIPAGRYNGQLAEPSNQVHNKS